MYPAMLFIATLAVPPMLALSVMPPPTDGPVIVLTLPWQDGAAMIESAGGRLIGPEQGRLRNLASGDAAFIERLSGAGALSVLPARDGWLFCGVST